jgi:hypothetical protein
MGMEVVSMSDTVEEFVFTVGDIIVSPSLGHAELVLALVVALAFLVSAVLSLFGQGKGSAS